MTCGSAVWPPLTRCKFTWPEHSSATPMFWCTGLWVCWVWVIFKIDPGQGIISSIAFSMKLFLLHRVTLVQTCYIQFVMATTAGHKNEMRWCIKHPLRSVFLQVLHKPFMRFYNHTMQEAWVLSQDVGDGGMYAFYMFLPPMSGKSSGMVVVLKGFSTARRCELPAAKLLQYLAIAIFLLGHCSCAVSKRFKSNMFETSLILLSWDDDRFTKILAIDHMFPPRHMWTTARLWWRQSKISWTFEATQSPRCRWVDVLIIGSFQWEWCRVCRALIEPNTCVFLAQKCWHTEAMAVPQTIHAWYIHIMYAIYINIW